MVRICRAKNRRRRHHMEREHLSPGGLAGRALVGTCVKGQGKN